MKTLFVLLFCVLGMVAYAQTKDWKLVADETWFVKSGATGFRIVSSNDTISKRMITKFSMVMTKMTHVAKRDRHGPYWERSFYFKNDEYNIVVLFINNGFK